MDKLRIVRNMESEEKEILGIYVGQPDPEGHFVVYMTADNEHHDAPEDCVQIEDAPEGYEREFFGDDSGIQVTLTFANADELQEFAEAVKRERVRLHKAFHKFALPDSSIMQTIAMLKVQDEKLWAVREEIGWGVSVEDVAGPVAPRDDVKAVS